MTIQVSMNENDTPDNIFIVCLVSDKKYRKMGGAAGLKAAIKHIGNRNILISQLTAEELLKDNDDFESNLNGFINAICANTALQQVILAHKYSDFYKQAIERDRVDKLRSWLHTKTASIKVLDDPEKIDLLSDRVRTGKLVRQLCVTEGFELRGLQWPAFTENSDFTDDSKIKVPVIIKPVDACVTDESHWMTLIRDTSSYNINTNTNTNTLIQQFYEHYGVLYKVYVIGSEVIEMVARPSISASQPVIRFNTHKFKAAEGELSPAKHREAMQRLKKHKDLILEFTRRLKKELGLTWFGVDVIIPEATLNSDIKVAVIDINYMPGYDGITDLPDKLINAILE